jgi:ParB family chromosome partitioning protein
MGRCCVKGFKEIEVSKIQGPKVRDRLEIDPEYIQSLADDIRENGLINPLLVRPSGEGFEVIAGERRLLAVQSLGLRRVACHVQDVDDGTAAVLRAVENLGREDLSPIEEARIYERLIDVHKLTRDQVAKRVSKSAGVVKRRLDLLRMPRMLQDAIHRGQISYGVAEELWRLGSEADISYYLGFCVDHGATVAVVRQWVNDHKKAQRRRDGDVEGGGGMASPMEMEPTYISCSFCRGPVELGKDTVLRACPECFQKLREAGRG